MKTEEILKEREKTHGDFNRVAKVYSSLKNIIDLHINSDNATQRLSIDMILLKLSRIVCGNANYSDHWDDIAGYALLGRGGEERGEEKGCSDCSDSAQAIYSNMRVDFKRENEQLKEKNKQLELDAMRAHNKGVEAASDYYESILADLKNKTRNSRMHDIEDIKFKVSASLNMGHYEPGQAVYYCCDVCRKEQSSKLFEFGGVVMCGNCFNMNKNA